MNPSKLDAHDFGLPTLGFGGAVHLSDSEPPPQLRRIFLDEAAVHLAAVEAALATLGRAQDPPERVHAAEQMLRHLHTLKGAAGSVGLDRVGDKAHELEELCAEIHDERVVPTLGILEQVDEGLGTLGALLDGARERRVVETPPAPLPPAGAEEALAEPELRIPATHLEALQDGVGDLVILRARVERRLREFEAALRDLGVTRKALADVVRGYAGTPDDPRPLSRGAFLDRMTEIEIEFSDSSAHIERATRSLGGEVESLRRLGTQIENELRRARKVPLGWAFRRLPPTLRELEGSTGREAELVLTGGDVEVDKSVAEQIAEALLHLLRNAMAHGLESPSERLALGKPARGRIEVGVREENEMVFVTFADDGRGLDRQQIRRALIRRGRIQPEHELPEPALVSAIFEAGFSSRPIADRLAGRGLGLNIVKRAAVRMGGDVTVTDTPGHGTRFVLSAPNQGAISLAVLFKVSGQVYAVPAANVDRAQALDGHGAAPHAGKGTLPVLCLQTLLGAEDAPTGARAALQLHYGGQSFVVTCDKIIGPRTIVVRPLSPVMAALPLYAGVTVSGSGKAQLVLDVAALCEAARCPARAHKPAARVVPRVLVIDDSRLLRETTARTLLGAGFQPVTAEDGLEALELLGERHFDAVVTDLEMPRLDGFELIARIRQEPALKHLPIVVVSSRTTHAPRQRALAAGADAILPKGPHRKLLLDALTGLITRAHGHHHAGKATP